MGKLRDLIAISLLFPLLLFTAGALGQPLDDDVLRVRADEWFPINGDPHAALPGFSIEVLREIFMPEHIDVDYQLMGWARSLDLTYSGDVDCVVGSYKSEGRGLLFPKYPLSYDTAAFYVLADNAWRYKGPASLDGTTVAVIADYSYGAEVDNWLAIRPPNVHISHGREPLQRNLQMLLAGRVETLVASPLVMMHVLEQVGATNLVVEAGRISASEPFYFACNNVASRGARFIKMYNEGWEKLRASGVLAAIYAKYGVPMPLDGK